MAPTVERALALAMRYVSRRERSVEEVRAYVLGKVDDIDSAEAAVVELAGLGLLDDERFARVFTEDKLLLEEWGSERILRGLLARGIASHTAEAAIAASASAGERERAQELLCRRFPNAPSDRRERERALGVLLRKGFASELALDAVAAWARGDAVAEIG